MAVYNQNFGMRTKKAIGTSGIGPTGNFPIDIENRLDYCMWFNDFLTADDFETSGPTSATLPWVQDDIGSPVSDAVSIIADSQCGELLVDAGSADDTGINIQFTGPTGAGEFIIPQDGKSYAFGARFKKNLASSAAMLIGLYTTDTVLITAATGNISSNGGVGLYTGEDDADLQMSTVVAGGFPLLTMVDDTYVEVGFRVDVLDASAGTGSFRAWQRSGNKWLKSAINNWFNTGLPTGGICPSICVKNAPGTNASATIDYMWTAVER